MEVLVVVRVVMLVDSQAARALLDRVLTVGNVLTPQSQKVAEVAVGQAQLA
jgi:hypothetical protein